MFAGRTIIDKHFARLSPVFVALAFLLLCPGVLAPKLQAAGGTATLKRQAAEAQFAKAEEQRSALNSKPVEKRTLAEYKQVVSSYRRVYLITPHAMEVPDSLLAVAELYTEMGDRFGRSYYQSAVDSYQFLLHEYPANRYCQDAMLRSAKLQKDQLGDAALATKSYEEFLKKYPRAQRKREAQEALAELALLRDREDPATTKSAAAGATLAPVENELAETPSAHTASSGGERSSPGTIPRIRRIDTSTTADATRVIIDLEDTVQYSSARISNPDRIFFDLHAARLTPELLHGTIHVSGDLLTAVRVAQNQTGVVRVVLDLNGVKDYSASLMNNPTRLVIDLYGDARGNGNSLRAAKSKRAQTQPVDDDAGSSPVASKTVLPAPQPTAVREAASKLPTGANATNAISGSVSGTTAANSAPPSTGSSLATNKSSRAKSPRTATNSAKPDLIKPVTAPQPTHDGQSTLTRALGLKIGRIVIDAGHGGHDTGTIGPTGLMEKDLCLDVALRLGKIIQQRLPGADIVYTRSDDTFIPLEDRTQIANQAKADLFISIHANSSQDHAARGIETYYLNLKGSPDAMEVAARENATSQEGVHDLEDLVKKIARTEKIDESREFAGDIQDSLSKRIQKATKTVKNRGVRKAPFVVLIGADMPSILTEISFLSNAADEQLLKKPEYRQRVAEGLYQGVVSYLQSLNSVTLNLSGKLTPSRSTSLASVEQSRNQK